MGESQQGPERPVAAAAASADIMGWQQRQGWGLEAGIKAGVAGWARRPEQVSGPRTEHCLPLESSAQNTTWSHRIPGHHSWETGRGESNGRRSDGEAAAGRGKGLPSIPGYATSLWQT